MERHISRPYKVLLGTVSCRVQLPDIQDPWYGFVVLCSRASREAPSISACTRLYVVLNSRLKPSPRYCIPREYGMCKINTGDKAFIGPPRRSGTQSTYKDTKIQDISSDVLRWLAGIISTGGGGGFLALRAHHAMLGNETPRDIIVYL